MVDVPEEFTSLGFQAAHQIVQSMDTGALWERVKRAVARVVGQNSSEIEQQEGLLEEDKSRLADTNESQHEEIESEIIGDWRVRIKDALRRNPSAAEDLQKIIDDVRNSDEVVGTSQRGITQQAKDHGKNFYAERDQNIGNAL